MGQNEQVSWKPAISSTCMYGDRTGCFVFFQLQGSAEAEGDSSYSLLDRN